MSNIDYHHAATTNKLAIYIYVLLYANIMGGLYVDI